MTVLTKTCRTAAWIAGISLLSSLSVASAQPENVDPRLPDRQEMLPPPPGFPPPPPALRPPVHALYQASLQATDPVLAANKLLANVPQGSGKTYEVSISVRELPPEPNPAPVAPAPAK
ncbi:hypothetical protein J8655_15005 [Dickeya oryzae]|uniref:hypothetical protein n=1 Tax=Dickeya oryzae TaxID=1240404 RepID=UPI001AEC92DA|nr:hypothetical protein [Dickeya oryzae]MBP2846777.1 hypothetical protein [Dickeya oryzae]